MEFPIHFVTYQQMTGYDTITENGMNSTVHAVPYWWIVDHIPVQLAARVGSGMLREMTRESPVRSADQSQWRRDASEFITEWIALKLKILTDIKNRLKKNQTFSKSAQ
jgi:hypothetical protein